jgi:hypothetical protein
LPKQKLLGRRDEPRHLRKSSGHGDLDKRMCLVPLYQWTLTGKKQDGFPIKNVGNDNVKFSFGVTGMTL